MLTVKMLKDMPEHTVFATGLMFDNEEGLFMSGSGKELRWVAVRGGIWDWSIYTHFADRSIEWIQREGDKVRDDTNIKKCVECDAEAFAMYRF